MPLLIKLREDRDSEYGFHHAFESISVSMAGAPDKPFHYFVYPIFREFRQLKGAMSAYQRPLFTLLKQNELPVYGTCNFASSRLLLKFWSNCSLKSDRIHRLLLRIWNPLRANHGEIDGQRDMVAVPPFL
jgi:hypothetical protein